MEKYVCMTCGSDEVYEQVWMHINSSKGGEPVGDGIVWCEMCNGDGGLLSETEYQEMISS